MSKEGRMLSVTHLQVRLCQDQSVSSSGGGSGDGCQ